MELNLFIGDRQGFTSMIARLVGMMEYVRFTTLQAVQGMSVQELDFIPEPYGNSVGMLLEHFVAVEKYYQQASLDHPNPEAALGERWLPGLDLGQQGREQIKGHPLSYYLKNLADTRAETLAMFQAHDDAWLEAPLPLWGSTGNRHFMWFHVFEDEINHRGQIRLLVRHLPRLAQAGRLGVRFAPVTPDGLGMRCARVWEGGPAALAGLQTDDIVLEYDGQDVTQAFFYAIPLGQPAGVSSRFKLRRGTEVLEVVVERPT